MHALKVTINNEAPVVAGAEDLAVLSAIVSCLGDLGSLSEHSPHLMFELSGLTSHRSGVEDEHRHWLQRRGLQVGDRIVVEIIKTDKADPAVSSGKNDGSGI